MSGLDDNGNQVTTRIVVSMPPTSPTPTPTPAAAPRSPASPPASTPSPEDLSPSSPPPAPPPARCPDRFLLSHHQEAAGGDVIVPCSTVGGGGGGGAYLREEPGGGGGGTARCAAFTGGQQQRQARSRDSEEEQEEEEAAQGTGGGVQEEEEGSGYSGSETSGAATDSPGGSDPDRPPEEESLVKRGDEPEAEVDRRRPCEATRGRAASRAGALRSRYVLHSQPSLTGSLTGSWGSYDGLSNGVVATSGTIPGKPSRNLTHKTRPGVHGIPASGRHRRSAEDAGQTALPPSGAPYTRWNSRRCSIEFHFPPASTSQEAEMEVDSGSVLAFAGARPRAHSATYRRGCQTRRRRHFRPDCAGVQSTWSVLPAWLATGLVLTAALGHLLSFSLPLWARGRQAGPGRPAREGAGGWRGECVSRAGLQADLGDARFALTYAPPPRPAHPTPPPRRPPPTDVNVRPTDVTTSETTTSTPSGISEKAHTESSSVGYDLEHQVSSFGEVPVENVTTDLALTLDTTHTLEESQPPTTEWGPSYTHTNTSATPPTAPTTTPPQGHSTDLDLVTQSTSDIDLGGEHRRSNRTHRSSMTPPRPETPTSSLLRVKVTQGSGPRSSTRTEEKVGEYVTVGMWNICRGDTCWMWCMDRLPGWFRLVQAFTTLGLIFCLMTSSLAVCQIAMPHCKDKYLATGGAAIILLLGETFAAIAVSVFGAHLSRDLDLAEVTLHTSWSFYIALLSIVTGLLGVVFLFWDTRLAQLDKTAYFDIDQEDAEEEALRLS